MFVKGTCLFVKAWRCKEAHAWNLLKLDDVKKHTRENIMKNHWLSAKNLKWLINQLHIFGYLPRMIMYIWFYKINVRYLKQPFIFTCGLTNVRQVLKIYHPCKYVCRYSRVFFHCPCKLQRVGGILYNDLWKKWVTFT